VRIAIWDAPVRLFHWLLAVLVVFSFVSGKVGGAWLAWHMRSGETILVLLGFRLLWGFAGSDTARFAGFLRGPRAALHYARETWAGRHPRSIGHNPLGAWMVVAMLAILALQAFSGLFVDDEIATQGPLYAKASNAWIERMGAIHHVNQYVVLGAVVLHVAAIIVYWKVLRTNLVTPMLRGWMEREAAPAAALRTRSPLLALALLVASAAAVYALVVVYPAAP
jgi:cytochrome b